MFIDQLSNAGSLPALEAAMRYAAQRQKLIAHNIANFETPNFVPVDVKPEEFQRVLGRAIEERRERNGGSQGSLHFGSSREIEMSKSGGLTLRPRTPVGGVLAHDRNASDLERTMQSMVENAAMFRVAADLHRAQAGVIRKAIGERAG